MLSDLFVRKISDFIRTNGLLSLSEKHLVALSGGADSVVLALVMQQLGYHVEAVHCNFRLRGDESDRDERFCVKLIQRLLQKCEKLVLKWLRGSLGIHISDGLLRISVRHQSVWLIIKMIR